MRLLVSEQYVDSVMHGATIKHISISSTNSTHAISRHAATSPHNIQRHNYTEYFDRITTLARLCGSSPRMVEDRNIYER